MGNKSIGILLQTSTQSDLSFSNIVVGNELDMVMEEDDGEKFNDWQESNTIEQVVVPQGVNCNLI